MADKVLFLFFNQHTRREKMRFAPKTCERIRRYLYTGGFLLGVRVIMPSNIR